MARMCQVCQHKQLEEINRQILNGTSLRDISGQYGIGRSSISRHKGHLPTKLLKSQDAKEALEADSTFNEFQKAKTRIEKLSKKTYDLLAKAEKTTNHNACIGYIREAIHQEGELREQRKLLAQIEGELAAQQINLNIDLSQSSEWINLRTQILRALEPFPEAKKAVVNALK